MRVGRDSCENRRSSTDPLNTKAFRILLGKFVRLPGEAGAVDRKARLNRAPPLGQRVCMTLFIFLTSIEAEKMNLGLLSTKIPALQFHQRGIVRTLALVAASP